MGYCITYETGRKPKKRGKWRQALAFGAGIVLGCWLLGLRREAAPVLEALAEAVQGDGSVQEAVEAFCRAAFRG